MGAKIHHDFEGRYAIIDRNGKQSQARTVTLRLWDDNRLSIYEFPELLFDIPFDQISSVKKITLDYSNDYTSIRFELPLRQALVFWPFQPQEKTDELLNIFTELKQRAENEDANKEGLVHKLIDEFLETTVEVCKWDQYMDISVQGQDLLWKIKAEVPTMSPLNIPHTVEECTLLVRKRIEQAITNKELTGGIDPKNQYQKNYKNRDQD